MSTATPAQLTEVALKIQAINPGALIGGGLALWLQDVKSAREPSDIDINLPLNTTFKLLDGMTEVQDDEEADKYENEEYDRYTFLLHPTSTIKIDFFVPVKGFSREPREKDAYYTSEESKVTLARCVHFGDIIRQKILYAFADHKSKHKHRDDIIFMMNYLKQTDK